MTSKRSFLKQIQASMGSLLEKHGFSLLEEKEEPEHFGDAFAKFESTSILLRFAKDRGDILVNVARKGSKAEHWHRLEDILKICGTDGEKRKVPEILTNDLGSVKSALAKNLGAIEDRFSKLQVGSTEKSLNAIEQEEAEAVVARIFGEKRPVVRSKVG
jgi:hypothetical protein